MDYTVKVLGDAINLHTDCQETIDFLLDKKTFFNIDDYSLFPTNSKEKCTLIYKNSSKKELFYYENENTLYFSSPWEEVKNTTLLRALILQLIEVERQRKGKFLIHSSAVERDGKGIVFWGSSGAGKTSLILALCMRYGYKLISNDMTVIGGDNFDEYIYSGTKTLNLRQSSIETYFPKLYEKTFGNNCIFDKWNSKVKIKADDVNIEISNGPIQLNAIISIAIQKNWSGRSYTYTCQNSEERWIGKAHLNEQLSRYIRGTAYTLMSPNGKLNTDLFMPLLDSSTTFNKRYSFIDIIADKGKIHSFKGDLEQACNLVNQII